ncbi:hypothetical protein J2X11_001676 [Aeromicrobium panaciterrae]|uniref:Sacsin/Nov domain-containing protein n=1 Tax=Aeromicrobium panaciterrae TaxID=363861 RepID=A0ABU1UNS6_9ACTN|nr:hypothetical protein [Aeromicrobium panaciterrae]MDR7086837.1 hypothetical protein [Aeromicrobium panaciterrae]
MAESAVPEEGSFTQLREKRLSYVTAARENGFEKGLRTLLAELYPDEAHFIYELLQNAEDAQASAIEFDLTDAALTATHNGRRQFRLADIEAITSIGNSTKKDDETLIGKFGVGFKAVFAYTDRPEVRSGEHAFAIVDLFVPEKVDAVIDGLKTTFAFPFDRAEKPAGLAYQEIEKALRALDEKTLLFLTNISSISYTLADGTIGILDRKENDDLTIVIQKSEGANFVESHWLRLIGPASVQPTAAGALTVAAAFSLSEKRPLRKGGKSSGSNPPRSRGIVPLAEREGEVSIYFPAVKEEAGLRFHIHAPFASTVARDSVRATPENQQLVEDIGALIASHLAGFRDLDLIDDGLLEALPNAGDALEWPYSAIRDAVVEAFDTQALAPIYGGGFAPATQLVSTPEEVRSGLEMKDLPLLLELAEVDHPTEPRWIAPRRGRAERFLSQLATAEFGWDGLNSALEAMEVSTNYVWMNGRYIRLDQAPTPAQVDKWTAWLGEKSDAKLLDLYRLIGHGVYSGELDSNALETIPIVRLRRKGEVVHVRGTETFLPESRSDKVQARVPVELAYFDSDVQDDPGLRTFYKSVGVERWNADARVDTRLQPYRDGALDAVEVGDHPAKHLEDMAAFVKHCSADSEVTRKMFTGVEFVLAADDGAEWDWVSPESIYLDEPFHDTGLAAIYQQTRWALPGIYLEIEGIAEFLVKAGAIDRVRFVNASARSNPMFEWSWARGTRESAKTVKRDWDIEHFDAIVAANDTRLFKSLWEAVATVGADHATATYRANASNPIHRFDSRAKQRLESAPWIPSPNGDLVRPSQIERQHLPSNWVEPRPGSLAIELNFGAEAHAIRERETQAEARYEQDLEAVERLGISSKNLDIYRDLEEIPREDLMAFLAEQRDHARLAEASSLDPVRRAEIATADAVNATQHRTEQKLRSVVVGADTARADSKNYLREHYTTAAGDMSCQACWRLLPFKVSGRWYFEAIPFARDRKYVHVANAIALCPLCAALYQHKSETKPTDLVASLLDIKIERGQGSVEIPVLINDKRVRIRLTGKHAIDLQSALRAAGEQRSK